MIQIHLSVKFLYIKKLINKIIQLTEDLSLGIYEIT